MTDRGQKMGPPDGIFITIIIALIVGYVAVETMAVLDDPDRMCADAYGEEWSAVPNATLENGTYHCIAENGTRRNRTIRNLTSRAASQGAIFGAVVG